MIDFSSLLWHKLLLYLTLYIEYWSGSMLFANYRDVIWVKGCCIRGIIIPPYIRNFQQMNVKITLQYSLKIRTVNYDLTLTSKTGPGLFNRSPFDVRACGQSCQCDLPWHFSVPMHIHSTFKGRWNHPKIKCHTLSAVLPFMHTMAVIPRAQEKTGPERERERWFCISSVSNHPDNPW